jgi:Domain of unknown function (DUF6968)
MNLTSVGQVIATREIREEGSRQVAYFVKIGLPQPLPNPQTSGQQDFYCPIQVGRGSDQKGQILYSCGTDSVQALQLAMKLIGGILFRLNQEHGGILRWDGDERGEVGFPLPI